MIIFILLLLMIVNALFAMAEMAIVSSRKARLQQLANEGNRGAATALELSAHPDRFLSTVQIGLSVISILAGAFGERSLVATVAQKLEQYPQVASYSETLGFVIVIAVLAYVTLVIGELVPKRLALLNPERLASAFAGPLSAVSSV